MDEHNPLSSEPTDLETYIESEFIGSDLLEGNYGLEEDYGNNPPASKEERKRRDAVKALNRELEKGPEDADLFRAEALAETAQFYNEEADEPDYRELLAEGPISFDSEYEETGALEAFQVVNSTVSENARERRLELLGPSIEEAEQYLE